MFNFSKEADKAGNKRVLGAYQIHFMFGLERVNDLDGVEEVKPARTGIGGSKVEVAVFFGNKEAVFDGGKDDDVEPGKTFGVAFVAV